MLSAVKFRTVQEGERHADEKESSRRRAKKRKSKDIDRSKGKSKHRHRKKLARSSEGEDSGDSSSFQESDRAEKIAAPDEQREDAKTKRKEAGLEWMLHAPDRPLGVSTPSVDIQKNPTLDSEKPESHARELNPYIAAGSEGSGQQQIQKTTFPQVGDGGASWRLKALKRAQEQAAREGRDLDEVVQERWESVGSLASSVAVKRSAHSNAHLHAIRDRKYRKDVGSAEGSAIRTKELGRPLHFGSGDGHREHREHREYRSEMKVPSLESALTWKKSKKYENQSLRDEDASIIRTAAKSLNKYASDGSFLKSFEADAKAIKVFKPTDEKVAVEKPEATSSDALEIVFEPTRLFDIESEEEDKQGELPTPSHKTNVGGNSVPLSANQVAAKAMRLRLMGKAKEADDLLKDFQSTSNERRKSTSEVPHIRPEHADPSRQVMVHGKSLATMRAQEQFRASNRSADSVLAGTIVRNKSYKGKEDDEYDDYANGLESERVLEKKGNKKFVDKGKDQSGKGDFRRLVTQQEQCRFCFENKSRPKHLVIALANYTYLMIPPTPSVVPFHCYIVPMQHDGATRNVDESVWQELRNFKKCLVQMFGSQGKEVLFLETAMALSKQRRHCFVECIPVPPDAAKDAPLYFKKAIDEAEDEWSQHDAKKLIDTRQKGLRNSIPKNFPYFHVEFGLQGGYCHIIDDESKFKPQFGHDVVAGILDGSDDDSRDPSRATREQQMKEVKAFLKLWEPFDWTKMLD